MKALILAFTLFFGTVQANDTLKDTTEVIAVTACAFAGYTVAPILGVAGTAICESISEFFFEDDEKANIEKITNEHQAHAYAKEQLYNNITIVIIAALLVGWVVKSPFAMIGGLFRKIMPKNRTIHSPPVGGDNLTRQDVIEAIKKVKNDRN